MEKKDVDDCLCDESENVSAAYSSSDLKSTTSDSPPSTSKLSDLALMRRSGLTVEEIFAQEIYEWRKSQGANMPFNITVERASEHPDYIEPSATISDTTNQPSARPTKRPKNFSLHRAKSMMTANDEEVEGDAVGSRLKLRGFDVHERFSKGTATLNLRRTKTMSPTGSNEESERDEEAKYERRIKSVGPIIRDIIRLLVVFCGSFIVVFVPWQYVPMDVTPKTYKFNITRKNICFWLGSKGILDPNNPCPYRAYLHITNNGKDCIKWSDVWENQSLVNQIAKEAEANPNSDAVLANESFAYMEQFKREWPEDYDAPFCRRLGSTPKLLFPHCFVYMNEDSKEKNESPVLQSCWAVPCSQTTANECYKLLWENMKKSKQQKP